jgi:transcriptional regulator with XRE-family HTH domain
MTSETPKTVRSRRATKTVIRPKGAGNAPKLTELYRNEDLYLSRVGERIRQRRIEIGYDDQQVFKDALGTSQSYVSKVERGEGLKLLIALVNLCSVLDCSLDYLALRSDDPRPYFPDVIDELTIMYQPENPHHRAALLQLMRLVEVMTPDQQMLLLRVAELLADQTDQGSVATILMQQAAKEAAAEVSAP